MPSNSEMYERGALDAEHDDLNLFYYQHYYYYRKGYDDARRQLRRTVAPANSRSPLLLAVAVVALLAVAGAVWLGGRNGNLALSTAPTSVATGVPTRVARATPTRAPTAAPTFSPQPALAVGGRARVVNLNGAPLRVREGPGAQARLVARIPENSEVTLLEGPTEADGYVWWRVQAGEIAGWCAGRTPEGVIFLEPLP